jgi:uncharacterized protein YqeY
MSLLDQVQDDVKSALKARDRERVHALRLIADALQKAEKDDGGDPDEELNEIVGNAVAESGASSPQEMGRVMGLVMPHVKGRADGKRVSAAVKEMLTP